MNMKNLRKAVEELNENDFDFVIVEEEKMVYIYDARENYNINYVDDVNEICYEASIEFGFKFEPMTEDDVFEKLESAIKKDFGQDVYLDWETSTRLVFAKN